MDLSALAKPELGRAVSGLTEANVALTRSGLVGPSGHLRRSFCSSLNQNRHASFRLLRGCLDHNLSPKSIGPDPKAQGHKIIGVRGLLLFNNEL